MTDPNSVLRLTTFIRSGTMLFVHLSQRPRAKLHHEYSNDFITWVPGNPTGTGTGNPLTFAFFEDPIIFPRLFLRLRVGP